MRAHDPRRRDTNTWKEMLLSDSVIRRSTQQKKAEAPFPLPSVLVPRMILNPPPPLPIASTLQEERTQASTHFVGPPWRHCDNNGIISGTMCCPWVAQCIRRSQSGGSISTPNLAITPVRRRTGLSTVIHWKQWNVLHAPLKGCPARVGRELRRAPTREWTTQMQTYKTRTGTCTHTMPYSPKCKHKHEEKTRRHPERCQERRTLTHAEQQRENGGDSYTERHSTLRSSRASIFISHFALCTTYCGSQRVMLMCRGVKGSA